MNLKNRATGKIVPMPPGEPEIFVGPDYIRPGWRKDMPMADGLHKPRLTEEEIVERAEVKRKEECEAAMEASRKALAARELFQARMHGMLWACVGLVLGIATLAYVAEFVMSGKAPGW